MKALIRGIVRVFIILTAGVIGGAVMIEIISGGEGIKTYRELRKHSSTAFAMMKSELPACNSEEAWQENHHTSED